MLSFNIYWFVESCHRLLESQAKNSLWLEFGNGSVIGSNWLRFSILKTKVSLYCILLRLNPSFGSKERKWEERKLRISMNELRLILVQIHSLICVIFFPFTFFPSNQTEINVQFWLFKLYNYLILAPWVSIVRF
jgi:hypothetical protein